MASLDDQIIVVQISIEKVEKSIEEVEKKIVEIEKKIEEAIGNEKEALRAEKAQLRDEKALLHAKETQLRAKEMIFLNATFHPTGTTGTSVTAPSMTYGVPAFEIDFEFRGDFLKTPLPSSVPMQSYVGYQSPDMDMNSFDRRISPSISLWMYGRVGDGEHGMISRNDALFSVYTYLANLGKYSRNKHEDSPLP